MSTADPAGRVEREPLAAFSDHQSLQERTYQTLRASLLNGEFAVEERLYEAELATQLGVSRSPVREAIRRLQQDGLIDVRPRNGIYVASLRLDEIDDVYRIRGALEGVAARLAAERMSDEERAIFGAMMKFDDDSAGESEARARLVISHADNFHKAVHGYAKSPRLLQLLELLYSKVQQYRNVTLRIGGRDEVATREHEAIAQAIIRRDSAGAERLMRDHIDGARLALITGGPHRT